MEIKPEASLCNENKSFDASISPEIMMGGTKSTEPPVAMVSGQPPTSPI